MFTFSNHRHNSKGGWTRTEAGGEVGIRETESERNDEGNSFEVFVQRGNRLPGPGGGRGNSAFFADYVLKDALLLKEQRWGLRVEVKIGERDRGKWAIF